MDEWLAESVQRFRIGSDIPLCLRNDDRHVIGRIDPPTPLLVCEILSSTQRTDASIWKDSSLAREWRIISTLMSRPPRVSWSSVVLSCSVLLCAVDRRSKRSSRLSALKSKSIVENKKEEEPVPALQEEAEKEIEIEDPPEIYQQGDIIWLRVVGSPWWPALIYGTVNRFPPPLCRIRSFL